MNNNIFIENCKSRNNGVKKRICDRCGKVEHTRSKFNSPYCRRCQKYLGNIKSRNKLIAANMCIGCGKKKAKANKCPHCKKIISYCKRCEDCLKKARKK